MTKIYVIVSETEAGEYKKLKCVGDSPQAAVDYYALHGKFTPVAWLLCEFDWAKTHTGEEMYEYADGMGQVVIESSFGRYTAVIPGDTKDYPSLIAPITPGPRKPVPEVCPEVWNTKPYDADAVMAAVRLFSGEGK